jgi:hypothetical protein
MIELVSGMPAPQFGANLSECEDKSWFKVQVVLFFVLIDVRCFRVLLKRSSRTSRGTRTQG